MRVGFGDSERLDGRIRPLSAQAWESVGDSMSESNASRQMPKYLCHKEVWALKIGEGLKVLPNGDVILPILDTGYAPVIVAKAVVSRYMPMPGDYYVVYEDGYKSISPAKAFEEGYTLIG